MARILVIDDDASIRRFLRLVLAGAGYEVAEADEGAAGLAEFRRRPADLVFCDLFMPGMDGLETIRLLRRECPDVRILAMSGGSTDGRLDVLHVASLLGAVEVLRKPFGRAALLAAVDEFMPRPNLAG